MLSGSSGTCKACKKGLFQMCDNELINGITKNGGCKSCAGLFSKAASSSVLEKED
jgi:D-arabinose 1-dehydrogenase-like Zn-dependent alcohol dehydrogenase